MAKKLKKKRVILKKRKAVTKKRKVSIRKSKIQNPKSKIRRVKKTKKAIKRVIRKKSKTKKIFRKILRRKIIKKPAKKIVRAKKRKVKDKSAPETFSAESLFRAKIKVIGVGGGGGSIVSEIGRSLKKATFVIADTDIRALKKKSGIKYFWFGENLTHGLGTGVNVDIAKQAAEEAKEKISEYFKDQDIVIFVASLGGGLGSGATQVFADVAREFGGITFGIFTMPFKFEGKNKQRIAQNALKELRKSLNVSLVIPNEKIFKVIDEATPITNAFSTVNKSLIGSLESLIDLIYNPGIINIDFADLRTILSGKGNSAFLNTIEESGKNRVERVCENIFKNPLLQMGGFDSEKILFNISGAEGLSMFDVEKISSHISNLNPKAKIIFGISKNPKLKNKIKTTILMTGLTSGLRVEEKVFVSGKAGEKLPKKEIGFSTNPNKEPEVKKVKIKKAKNKKKLPEKVIPENKEDPKEAPPISFIPVFETPTPVSPVIEEKMIITQVEPVSNKKTIRRSGLEIKKAEELQEKKRIAQEKEWETPAFLRKIKFKG